MLKAPSVQILLEGVEISGSEPNSKVNAAFHVQSKIGRVNKGFNRTWGSAEVVWWEHQGASGHTLVHLRPIGPTPGVMCDRVSE